MKISNTLFQFPKPALLLALDGRTARIFRAVDGVLTEQAPLTLPQVKTKQRRTLFRASGRGGAGRAGAPSIEPQRSRVFVSLLKQVNERAIEELRDDPFEHVYLCAPQSYLSQAKRLLHPDLKKRLKRALGVDLVHGHPRQLVEAVSAALVLSDKK